MLDSGYRRNVHARLSRHLKSRTAGRKVGSGHFGGQVLNIDIQRVAADGGTVSERTLSLRNRLKRVERALIAFARRQEPANCNCQEVTSAHPEKPDQFEAEMNAHCSVHYVRRLGRIIRIRIVGQPETDSSRELDRLIREYEARQSPADRQLLRVRLIGRALESELKRELENELGKENVSQ